MFKQFILVLLSTSSFLNSMEQKNPANLKALQLQKYFELIMKAKDKERAKADMQDRKLLNLLLMRSESCEHPDILNTALEISNRLVTSSIINLVQPGNRSKALLLYACDRAIRIQQLLEFKKALVERRMHNIKKKYRYGDNSISMRLGDPYSAHEDYWEPRPVLMRESPRPAEEFIRDRQRQWLEEDRALRLERERSRQQDFTHNWDRGYSIGSPYPFTSASRQMPVFPEDVQNNFEKRSTEYMRAKRECEEKEVMFAAALSLVRIGDIGGVLQLLENKKWNNSELERMAAAAGAAEQWGILEVLVNQMHGEGRAQSAPQSYNNSNN